MGSARYPAKRDLVPQPVFHSVLIAQSQSCLSDRHDRHGFFVYNVPARLPAVDRGSKKMNISIPMARAIRVLLATLAIASLSTCGGDGGSSNGTLEVSLTDSP